MVKAVRYALPASPDDDSVIASDVANPNDDALISDVNGSSIVAAREDQEPPPAEEHVNSGSNV